MYKPSLMSENILKSSKLTHRILMHSEFSNTTTHVSWTIYLIWIFIQSPPLPFYTDYQPCWQQESSIIIILQIH